MNGIKVSQLPEAVDVNNSDIAMIVQEGSNKKVSVENLLASKQDVLTAGTGIDITDGVISNTQTSANWGNITGTLSNQTDLQNALDSKQDDLVSGTNIKTINNNSVLGSGNLTIQEGETLPVGSEIDFDGTAQDIPVGWEEVNTSSIFITDTTTTNSLTAWTDTELCEIQLNKGIYIINGDFFLNNQSYLTTSYMLSIRDKTHSNTAITRTIMNNYQNALYLCANNATSIVNITETTTISLVIQVNTNISNGNLTANLKAFKLV